MNRGFQTALAYDLGPIIRRVHDRSGPSEALGLHDLGGRFLLGHENKVSRVAELARILSNSAAGNAHEVDMLKFGFTNVSGIGRSLSAMLTNIGFV
jgi:hypothetical protein